MTPAAIDLQSMLSCVTYTGAAHTNILIKETDPAAKLRLINVQAPLGDWLAFDPDKGRGRPPVMSKLLRVGAGLHHHKACDAVFVVIDAVSNSCKLVFIDLKSDAPSGFKEQFQSTYRFTMYMLGLLEEFFGHSFDLIECRFFLLHTGSSRKALLNKRPTLSGWKNRASNDPRNPQMELVNNGQRLYLKQFLE